MQEIVSENINDLEFLKITLELEIAKIQNTLESLTRFQKVQTYIGLDRKRKNLKKNNVYKDPQKAEIKDRIEELINAYDEVKQYSECLKTLEFYQINLQNLDDFIAVEGVIYNKAKERKEKILYSPKTALKHLLIIKQSEGLPLETTLEEFNNYINAVRTSLQDYRHYDNDKEVNQILGFKVYENPHNYDIRNVEEIPIIDQISLTNDNKLSVREEEAFYGTRAYKTLGLTRQQDQVKRIGERKNARYNSSNIN